MMFMCVVLFSHNFFCNAENSSRESGMSIVFVFSGLVVLSVLFGIIKVNDIISRYILVLCALTLCLSYFFGDIYFVSVKFNLLLCIIILLLLLVNVTSLSIDMIIFSIIGIGLYLSLIEFSLDYLISINRCMSLLLIGSFSLLYLNRFRKGILMSLLLSLGVTLVSGVEMMENLGFAEIDLNFVFESILLYLIIYFIFAMCMSLFSTREVCYGKKKFISNLYASSCFILF